MPDDLSDLYEEFKILLRRNQYVDLSKKIACNNCDKLFEGEWSWCHCDLGNMMMPKYIECVECREIEASLCGKKKLPLPKARVIRR